MNLDNPITVPIESRYHRFYVLLFFGVCALVGSYIFFSPFPYTTSLTNISFYLAIFMAVILILFKAFPVVIMTPLTFPFIFFFLWSCLSLIWALNFENTLNDVRGHLLNHLILFFLLINFFNSKNRLNWLVWIVVASAVAFSVVGAVFYYVIMDNSVMGMRFGNLLADGRHIWTELSVDILGTLTIPAMLFCFYLYGRVSRLSHRFFLIMSAGIILVATILTQSRGTLTALIIAGFVFLVVKNRKLLPLFLVGIILVFIFSPYKNRIDTFTFFERIKINYIYLEVVKDYPLGGIGFGMRTFQDNLDSNDYVKKVPEKLRPVGTLIGPHSWLLDIMIRTGVIGFLLFLLIIFAFLRMSWQVIRKARDNMIRDMGIYVSIAFLSYFIIGLAEPVFWGAAPAMMFYILMAMMTALWLLNRAENQQLDHDASV
ncbi:MAG: O-antigen ligase family protein [Smithellaceae bacterium]